MNWLLYDKCWFMDTWRIGLLSAGFGVEGMGWTSPCGRDTSLRQHMLRQQAFFVNICFN
jgi:hypothetical protein